MLITHKNNLKTKFYFNKINNKNNNIIILKIIPYNRYSKNNYLKFKI